MAIAGIDIGTTGCKCTAYNSYGIRLAESYIEYESTDSEGRELDPNMVWKNVKKVIAKVAGSTQEPIRAIGVTSFGEAFVMLDKQDCPVMNTMLYTDERGNDQCTRLVEKLGRTGIMQITGVNPSSNYSLAKIMWIKENRPDCYERTRHILLYADYIVYMLTGLAVTDYSLACRTMAFDYKNLCWSHIMLEAADVDEEKMASPVPTGSYVGKIRKSIVDELQLTDETIVSVGCHDQIAAAVGSATFENGMSVNGAGTVECITPIFGKVENISVMMNGNYCIVPYVTQGSYVTYAYSNTGGALLKWYRDKIAYMEAAQIKADGKDAYEEFNRKLSSKPSDLLILPYFAGSATPYMDVLAKGAIVGVTLETTSLDIYQALMEAVAYEDLLNKDMLEEAGIRIEKLYSCGGGARSPYWGQLKSDVLNVPIESLGNIQVGTQGSVMMAGVAAGIYKDLKEAAVIFRKPGVWYYPRQDMHNLYMEKYERYKKMYHAVKNIL